MADSDIPFDYDLNNSVEGRVLLRTAERIKALNLVSIGERVEVRKLPWLEDGDELTTPCVIVSPAPETTDWQSGTNESTDVVFAMFVTVVLANARDVSIKGMGLQLRWREQLRRAFVNKCSRTWSEIVLPAGAKFLRSYVESGDKFIEAAKRSQRDAQYYLIRVVVREQNTLT